MCSSDLQVGVQIWTPPELTTEVRVMEDGAAACEPCMWRRGHENSRSPDIPPASIAGCPEGRSLRDITADQIIHILELE